MNLTRLEYFLEAARYENFSQAAQKLYTSQPNLSKQISILEQELGFKLFHRVNKTVCLTNAGKHFYEKLKCIPEVMEVAIEEAKILDREEAGTICIGILEGQEIGADFLNELQAYFDKHPELTCQMERASFKKLRRGLESCHYDIIVTLSFEMSEIKGIESLTILQQQGAIAISKLSDLAKRANLGICDLKDENFIAISAEESPAGYANLFANCARAGFTPKAVRQATSLESLMLCIEAGIGVAILDRNTRLEQNDSIIFIPLDENVGETNLEAVWLKERETPEIRDIAQIMRRN